MSFSADNDPFNYETPPPVGGYVPSTPLAEVVLSDDELVEIREDGSPPIRQEAAPTEVVEGEATAPELIMEADEPPDPAEPGARSQIVATWQAQQLAEMAQLDL
jgi:hypothetical protein